MAAVNEVLLERRELLYLLNIDELKDLVSSLEMRRSSHNHIAVTLENRIAQEISDALTTRLAKVGFDQEYELSSEGKIIDAIICKFADGLT